MVLRDPIFFVGCSRVLRRLAKEIPMWSSDPPMPFTPDVSGLTVPPYDPSLSSPAAGNPSARVPDAGDVGANGPGTGASPIISSTDAPTPPYPGTGPIPARIANLMAGVFTPRPIWGHNDSFAAMSDLKWGIARGTTLAAQRALAQQVIDAAGTGADASETPVAQPADVNAAGTPVSESTATSAPADGTAASEPDPSKQDVLAWNHVTNEVGVLYRTPRIDQYRWEPDADLTAKARDAQNAGAGALLAAPIAEAQAFAAKYGRIAGIAHLVGPGWAPGLDGDTTGNAVADGASARQGVANEAAPPESAAAPNPTGPASLTAKDADAPAAVSQSTIDGSNSQQGQASAALPTDSNNEIVVTAPMTTAAAIAKANPGKTENTLILSREDITNLKKTLQTEWVRSAGNQQAYGIIDTILNRVSSGHWGGNVSDVVDARKQFSDINGPIAWTGKDRIGPHSSVEEIPDNWVKPNVSDLVDSYLRDRANGTPSSVGENLNYANPNFSSPNNIAWIRALDGPVFSRGNAIHVHGTVPSLQRFKPQAYSIQLPQ